jgi:snurportin-1
MSDGSRGSDYCILDCVYDETQRCYYIIDLMCWRGQPLYDSDTEFRFFWLQSKVSDEIPALRVASDTNPYRFEV